MSELHRIVPREEEDFGHFASQDFSPRQLMDAYSTIFALKAKLELAAEELKSVCDNRRARLEVSVEGEGHKKVRLAILERGRRSSILPAHLFADPAWGILLSLYRAELRQCRIAVSNLFIDADVPATTGLRWIATLQSEGLVARAPDPFHGRRSYVRLTPSGSQAMCRFFSNGKQPRHGDV